MKISSLALTLALFPAALISTSIRAVAGPAPTEVQGVVEVLNDVLYTPYARVVTTQDGSLPWASFDVPAGKRLIIETISFQGMHPTAAGVKRVLIGTRRFGQHTTVHSPRGPGTRGRWRQHILDRNSTGEDAHR